MAIPRPKNAIPTNKTYGNNRFMILSSVVEMFSESAITKYTITIPIITLPTIIALVEAEALGVRRDINFSISEVYNSVYDNIHIQFCALSSSVFHN